ncbi:flagellin [Lacimonas salitolerans]|uniref:Flagellin n=1 Tax=Lacimonas salitolerans TaxID=1323750 RepID=A0ABW4EKE5_9RHOB
MALAIATNTGALMAAASATSVNKDMETSMERLSTGKRINSAKDDAAGVAIASRLSSEIRGTNQAIRNAQDGQALINTAEGAHKEIENILQRMRELAVQSSNDTNDGTDRTNLQAEMDQLVEEIDRISSVTTWAGQSLLNGAAAGAGTAQFNFQIGGNTGDGDRILVEIDAMSSKALAVSGAGTPPAFTNDTFSGDASGSVTIDDDAGTITFASTEASGAFASGATFTADINGTTVKITVVDNDSFTDDEAGVAAQFAAEIAKKDELRDISVSAAAGVLTLKIGGGLDIGSTSTTSSRDTAINAIDAAIEKLNTQRANLGAVANRLDNTVSNLTNVAINLEGGKGRIEDADFAAESTSLAKSQILQQASTAMLAQANASKQNVLSLLQG